MLTVIENELVPVYETDKGAKVVYGTELHKALEVKTKYADWVVRRLSECDAEENQDYQVCFSNLRSENRGGQNKKEYIIKLNTAKEMAMLERNERGKQVRRYFIAIEDRYKKAKFQISDLSPELQMVHYMFEQIAKQEIEQKRQSEEIENVKGRVEGIRNIVALNPKDWRKETDIILKRISLKLGGGDKYKEIRRESYDLLESRMGVSLNTRLKNKCKRMLKNGISQSVIDKVNYIDIINEDKKLIEGYISIVKELAVKYD